MRIHVCTFHKCGSNWFRRLFRDAATVNGANIWVARPNPAEINTPVETGSDHSLMLYRNGSRNEVREQRREGERTILCIRDPKDVVVSQYWSWKKSHVQNSPKILAAREALSSLSDHDGVLKLIQDADILFLNAIKRWTRHLSREEILLLRYEDLLSDFEGSFSSALDYAGLSVPANEIARMKEENSFQSMANRKPGEEDTSHHYRKGVAGDWQNYFDAEISEAFNGVYGEVCTALGYSLPDAQGVSA